LKNIFQFERNSKKNEQIGKIHEETCRPVARKISSVNPCMDGGKLKLKLKLPRALPTRNVETDEDMLIVVRLNRDVSRAWRRFLEIMRMRRCLVTGGVLFL